MDRKPSQLSGGQRQRVAIGRALVKHADVLLFDEPLSNLDAKLRTEMRLEIKRLHDELNPTVVYVTHDQIEAMTMATKIAVMNGGVIQQFGTPDEIYETPANLFVAGFIGAPAMNLKERADRQGERPASTGVFAVGQPDRPRRLSPSPARPQDGAADRRRHAARAFRRARTRRWSPTPPPSSTAAAAYRAHRLGRHRLSEFEDGLLVASARARAGPPA